MTMKKSLIALAVSSVVVAPATAQAAEVYGNVQVGWESTSTDNGGTGMIFNTTGDDSGGGAQDTWETRLGVSASEDIGNGLTAGANFELGLSTSSVGAGSVNEDVGFQTRLANVTLGGDFGMLKLGTQYGLFYEYAGWNHGRTVAHGFGGHYWFFNTASNQTVDPSGLRVDNAFTYTFGGGGYSSDPFTFSVQLHMDGNDEAGNQIGTTTTTIAGITTVTVSNTAVDDEEAIDAIHVAAQGTFGPVTVNGQVMQENNTDSSTVNVPEPMVFTIGARWSSGPFYVGGTFLQSDNDINNPGQTVSDEPNAILGMAGMDFGNGYAGKVGFGTGDADRGDGNGDMTNFYVEGTKTLGERTTLWAEFETASTEDTANGNTDDSDEQIFAVGVNHSF